MLYQIQGCVTTSEKSMETDGTFRRVMMELETDFMGHRL
jgi:hypothetical protein